MPPLARDRSMESYLLTTELRVLSLFGSKLAIGAISLGWRGPQIPYELRTNTSPCVSQPRRGSRRKFTSSTKRLVLPSWIS